MAPSDSLIVNSQQGNVYPKRQAMAALEDGKTLLLLKPRGFCAGVVRAIDIVRIALEAFGPPIYVRKDGGTKRFEGDSDNVEDRKSTRLNSSHDQISYA